MFLLVQGNVSFSFRRLLLELKETASRRLPLGSADLLSLVAIFEKQSAGLLSLETTPFNRTTTTLIVVQPYTL